MERRRRTVLKDITQTRMQVYGRTRNSPPHGMTLLNTPSPRTEVSGSVLRYLPPAQWIPLTPPRSGERPRSKSLTPNKNVTTPVAGPSSIRTSPRKRLQLSPPESPFSALNTPSPKKVKLDFSEKPKPPISLALEGLSKEQLVAIIGSITDSNPEIMTKLKEIIPMPDLKPVEEELKHLRKNIYRSLPAASSRLVSKTDASAFSRAQAHLINFKRYLLEEGTKLTKSEHWCVVVDFVFMAWNNVRQTPVWDQQYHNDIRKKCFKYLSCCLILALKNGSFIQNEILQIKKQVLFLSTDSREMEGCLGIVEELEKNNLSTSTTL